ncbi:oncoprotein-induced transcript 3 protein-like isoform X1 [Scyliorhinus torazame]|uniref:oncoprotein-induced transcript 3 protein-like isoform X1 n=2 Tax=Scyliorhinus torazame TaxID=75743 RepID=UPI003B5A6C40
MDGGGGQEGSAVLDSNKKHEHIADMPSEMKTLLLILGCLSCCHFLSADPCVNHTVLDQPWRSTNCANTDCSSVQCDNNLLTGWYRFNGPGGSTIPDQLVQVNHCSTDAPGWLNGSHPTPGDGEVNRTVCFHWSGNSCRWSQDIKIKRCRNYFVYYLKKSPACRLAYCTVKAVIPTLPPTPETTVPTTPETTLPQIASSMIVPNPTSPSPGMGGKQFQLVITLLGDFDPDSMQKIILELQLSFRERFPDLKLHLSLGES